MILVTGGGGFLGGAIVRKLRDRGDKVRVLGRRRYPHLAAAGVECLQGDITDKDACLQAVTGCEGVIHTAALAGVWGKYATYYQANFTGTRNLLDAARLAGVRRFLYTSTPSVVHGGHGIAGGDESLPYADNYLTPYAATKALAEQLVIESNSPHLTTAAIRPHLIYGPGDNHLIPKLLARARAGTLRIIGRGENLISVSYVDNVADSHLNAYDRLTPGSPVAGQVYFVNDPEPVNCWDFINSLVTGAGLAPIRKSVPAGLAYAAGWCMEMAGIISRRKSDPRLTRFLVTQLSTDHWFRVDKARRELEWEPAVSTVEGVRNVLHDLDRLASP